jgi:hypothetical protein
MNYEAFLGGLVDELEKAAKEDGGEPWHPTPDEKKGKKGKGKEKDDEDDKKDDEGEDEKKEAFDMSNLEVAFFDGLLDELEKQGGWRGLSAAAKTRMKAKISGARKAAADKLLASKGKSTGSQFFRRAQEGGTLQYARGKTTGRKGVLWKRKQREGKERPSGLVMAKGKKPAQKAAAPPAVQETAKKVQQRPMSGWGSMNWKDRKAAQTAQKSATPAAKPAAAAPKADPFAGLKQKMQRRRDLKAAAKASGQADVARFRKMDAAPTPKPAAAAPAAPVAKPVAAAGAKIQGRNGAAVRARNVAAGRFGAGGGPAGAPKPAAPTGILAKAWKSTPTPKPVAQPPKPAAAGGWGAAKNWSQVKRAAARILERRQIA